MADTHGVVYDSIKQKLSTAQSYGYLELKHGVGYKLTDKFLKVYKPVNEAEKREGLIDSLRLPAFYTKLIDELNGHPLPTEQGLSARLLRSFGIKDYAANKAAQIFLINLKENGFVTPNNILQVTSDNKVDANKGVQTQNGVSRIEKEETVLPKEQPLPSGYIEIPVPLNGGKRAYIRIPEDYKTEDCERIAKFIEALK